MKWKSIPAKIDKHASELYRILAMQVVLVPAAFLLPRSWGLAAAKVISFPLLLFPVSGLGAYRSMRRAFGGGPYRSLQLTWEWMAKPFRDFVVLRRVVYGREDISKWRIVEENAEAVAGLRESGQSFIVATGHFDRSAMLAVISPRITPGNFVQVSVPSPRELNRLHDLRLRIQYGTMLEVASTAWRRPFEFALVLKGGAAARLLFDRLRKPGNVALVHVDPPWPRGAGGSFNRPFAGVRDRSFAMGAARLAKSCQCPVVSCVCWREDDGTVFIKWGTPILRVDDQIDAMNQLIDPLEVAVGERPTKYVVDIGDERRWNAALRRWENLTIACATHVTGILGYACVIS